MIKVGIIGGSGLEKLNMFKDAEELVIDTEYGKPSSTLLTGKINNAEVAILSRHNRKHTIPPTQINNRANIMSLKYWGCDCILSTVACGSLKEEIAKGHIVFPDQFIDFTRHRAISFYEKFEHGKMAHTPMADPFDENLRKILIETAKESNLVYHPKGTVVTIEGPRFSTRAESHMFRSWGADLINMTLSPEVILANEAEIPYAAVALSTDYDCWKIDEDPVSLEAVLEIFKENANNVTKLIVDTISNLTNS